MSTERKQGYKEYFLGDVFVFSDGEQHIWRSHTARLCLEMTINKSRPELLQQALIRIYKENPTVNIGSNKASSAISHLNGGIKKVGWQIRCLPQKTEDGRLENRLGFVKVPTSSPAHRSPRVRVRS